jgi:tetratricopeptide (TPR) repeat protein
MKNHIQLFLIAALTLLLSGRALGEPILSPDVVEALATFQDEKANFKTRGQALDYLEEHIEESIDPLLEIVKTKGYRWQSVGGILARSQNDKVLNFYLELLANNLFETEADGSRRLWAKGVSYGGNIAKFLGKMGDERAIQALKDAVDQGDHQVRWAAIKALYYLGDLSMDQLFEMGINEGYHSTGTVILGIAYDDKYSDPAYILTVLDRFTETFPEEEFEVRLAHGYKAYCYDYLGKYLEALREIDIVFERQGYLSSPTKNHKERIWNKMIPPPTDTWTYTDAREVNAECSLSLNVSVKTNDVKVSTAYTSFFKSHNYSDTSSNSTHTLSLFPAKTSEPQSSGNNGTLEQSHSSFCVSGITETGIVVRVEFECSLIENEIFCDIDHSILIPFGGTGRCKKDDVQYRWKWENLKSRPSPDFIAPRDVLVVPVKKASVDPKDKATGLKLVGKWKAVFEPNIEVTHRFKANGEHVHEMLGGDMTIDGVWEVVGDTLRIKSGDIVLLGSKQKSSSTWVEHKIIYLSQEELHTQLKGRPGPVIRYVRMK